METVACRLTEQSASFTFSDGHHEDLKKHAIDQSSVIQDVLLEGQEQQDVTVTAPRTYLRSWCHLHKLLADSGSVEAAPLDKLVDFLEVRLSVVIRAEHLEQGSRPEHMRYPLLAATPLWKKHCMYMKCVPLMQLSFACRLRTFLLTSVPWLRFSSFWPASCSEQSKWK